MRIIKDYPPNIADIEAKFGSMRDQPVIYAWAPDIIFDPNMQPDKHLRQELLEHENVHCLRQLALAPNPRIWWDRYLADRDFRLVEEVLAHRAEYESLLKQKNVTSRNGRRILLNHVALRLTAPLYEFRISVADAKRYITKGG